MEIITGVERRRRWRPVQKLRILAELEEPGATVTAVARRHEVSRGLIWQWRGALRRGDLVVQEPAFLPMRVAVASGRCGNKGGVRRGPLEGRFLDSLAGEQTSPDLVALFIEELTAEWNRLTGDRSEARTAKRRYLAKVERKVAGLIDAIADGLRTQGPRERLEALEARRAVLAR